MSLTVYRRPSASFGKIGLSLLATCLLTTAAVATDDLFEPVPSGQSYTAPAAAWPDSPAVSGSAAVPQASSQASPAASPVSTGDATQSDDLFAEVPIYDRQAIEKLQAETSVTAQPHPLMMQYPDDFTVVCEAGCTEADAEIVYRERKTARGPVTQPGEKVQALPIEAARNVIECVGGCYLGERVYGATADAMAVGVTSEDTSWMGAPEAGVPAAKPVNRRNDTSGRWFDRIGG